MKLPVIFFLLCHVSFSWQKETIPRAKTRVGTLRGYYKISHSGKTYEAYEGVPYAEPPTGDLRFRPPHPVKKWVGERPAVEKSPVCLQFTMPSAEREQIQGSEDCLYINIYVPKRPSNQSHIRQLPVMFWIHGGAFQFGTGNELQERYIMDRSVVLVTVNYRLGALGFLSTHDEVVPGNMGLMDQSMALRWVSRNIKYFGGDPKKITIFGMSAGGASVHYHYLSPLSAGHFQRGISISGTAFDPWTQTQAASEKAKKLAALLGCSTTSTSEMIACLRTRPGREIAQSTASFMYWRYNPFTPFGPVVDKFGPAPFLENSPVEVIRSGKVYDAPWITGVVKEEGLYPAADFVASDKILNELNENWDEIAPHLLDFNYTIPLEKHKEVAEKVKQHYLQTRSIDENTVTPLVHMIGDRLFVYESEKAARMQAAMNVNPVWYYYYTYRSTRSLSDLLSGTNKNFGVCHGDDIFLVSHDYLVEDLSPADREMQKRLLDFYVSFAVNGYPRVGNAKWKTVDPLDEEFHYLHMASANNIAMASQSNFGEKHFWNSLNFNENKV